jgi:hypothetical protein
MARGATKRIASHLALILAGLLLVVVMLGLAEAGTRIFAPDVAPGFFETERTLFSTDPGPAGAAWRPGSSGFCFGQRVSIDGEGCRDLGRPEAPKASWLLLGDSVAFGVGVAGEETFAGRMQKQRPDVRIINTAVIGMTLRGYSVLARSWLEREPDPSIERIYLFYCLNDLLEWEMVQDVERADAAGDQAEAAPAAESEIGIAALLDPSKRSDLVQDVLTFLGRRSKLYHLLKVLLTRPDRRYYIVDRRNYDAIDASNPGNLTLLAEIDSLARARGIPFEVIILPYQHQLRSDDSAVWMPQDKVVAYLEEHGIAHRDARDWLRDASIDPSEAFLYGDPNHLSATGHRLVFDAWLRHVAER